MTESREVSFKIFISYSHSDEALKDRVANISFASLSDARAKTHAEALASATSPRKLVGSNTHLADRILSLSASPVGGDHAVAALMSPNAVLGTALLRLADVTKADTST